MLARIIGHLGAGEVTLKNGIISGALCCLGFIITTMMVNNSCAMRNPHLHAIDSGFWLVGLPLMGATIGGWGV